MNGVSGNRYRSDLTGDERLVIGIVRAAERFKKQMSSALNRHGLSFPQYNVLRVLDASVEGRNSLKLVNKIMLVNGANLSGVTKRLEKAGCIKRTVDRDDERSKWLQITDKGKQLLSSVFEEKERIVQNFLKTCPEDHKSEMLDILRHIVRDN